MKCFKRYLLAGAAAMTVLAAASPSQAACELKLGVVGGFSGATAQWGNAIKAAIEFVVKKANDAGGLQVGPDRCQISISTVDTKATAEGAAAAANQLVSQGIKFVLGPVVSPEATGIKPIATRNNMLVFLNSYAKNAIGPQWPLVFHEGPGPSVWADPIVKAAKAKFNIKSVVVVAPNDQGGTDIASVDVEVYKNNGIEAAEEYYQRGTTNFAAIITRILAKNPDAVDTASSAPSDAGIMVKQLRQAGFTGPIGRLGGAATDEIVRIAGSLETVKDFYWYENVATSDPKVLAVYDDFKQVMGVPAPENTTMILWVAAGQVLLDAISKAGTTTDTNKVAEVMRTLSVDDKYLGKGFWTGKSFFGIKQEIAFPFGIGMIVDGKMLPIQRVEAVDKD